MKPLYNYLINPWKFNLFPGVAICQEVGYRNALLARNNLHHGGHDGDGLLLAPITFSRNVLYGIIRQEIITQRDLSTWNLPTWGLQDVGLNDLD